MAARTEQLLRHIRRLASRPTLDELTARELLLLLDEEVGRLPEVYRLPVICCCLEGRTQEEAAALLGWTPGSVRGRLARGRARLHARLARRGLTLTAALAAVGVSQGVTAAGPTTLAARVLASVAGEGSRAAAPAEALADAALRGTALGKLKLACVLVVAVGAAALGAGVLPRPAPEAPPSAPAQVVLDPRQSEAPRPARTDQYGDPLPPGAVARLGTVRLRHEGEARALVFSPDEKMLAALCWQEVILWDVATAREVRRLPVHALGLSAHVLAFSPDGKALAVLPSDFGRGGRADITFWDPATGKELRSLPLPTQKFPEMAGGLCFTPDGKTLAVSRGNGRVHLIDVPTRKVRHTVGGSRSEIYGLAFSPDGKMLALGTLNPGVQLWDTATGRLVRGIDAHKGFVNAVAFTPDGKAIASGSWDRIVLSEVATGQQRARFETKMQSIHGLAFTPDGRTLVSGSQDGRVRAWDVATGRARLTLDAGWGTGRSMTLSPSGKIVAAGTSASALRLWDVATGRERFARFQGHDARVHALAFTPDGRLLLSGGDGQCRVWDTATWRPSGLLPGTARCLSLSPDGKRLLTVAYADAVRIRDRASGRDVLTVKVPDLRLAALSPDGKAVMTVECKWPNHSTRVSRWDAATGKQLGRVPGPYVLPYGFAVSPDGRTAVVGSGEGLIHLCDLEAGKEVLTLSGHGSMVEALAFSEDGRTLASGSYDKTVRLWETATGQEVLTLGGHRRAVGAVALSPDGRLLASADGPDHGYDGKEPRRIRVWEVAAGREVATFEGHDSAVGALAFSPDGARLVSGQQKSTLLVWDVARLARRRRGGPGLDGKRLETFWTTLAGGDARRARQAVWTLTDHPDEAVPFLKARLRPAREADPEHIRRLVADLGSDRFAARDAAARALKELGEQAEPALRQALKGKLALEARRRLERVLAGLYVPAGGHLRELRAVEVLEQVGSAEARQALEVLAGGAPSLRQTREAQAALARLAKGPAGAP
jgi:WD40 repeat protein